ncbi:MAG TPA: hypothetical protein VI306_26225 [Pyrinomonadaceae bacterium]
MPRRGSFDKEFLLKDGPFLMQDCGYIDWSLHFYYRYYVQQMVVLSSFSCGSSIFTH